MARQNHAYVNLPSKMMEVVYVCTKNILRNGAKVYIDQKDFIMRSIQKQIDYERNSNPYLDEKIQKYDLNTIIKEYNDKRVDKILGGNNVV